MNWTIIVAISFVILFACLLFTCLCQPIERFSSSKGAAVLVPGLGGSILEAKWNVDFDWKKFYCQEKQDEWTQVWPTAYSAIPAINDCWAKIIQPNLSSGGTRFSSAPGITVKAKDFGGLSGISVLDNVDLYFWNIPIVDYFKETIHALHDAGIKHVYGAPYDFRLILDPDYLQAFVKRFQWLIEKAYHESGGQVTLISHSLGCPTTTFFLNSMPPNWRKAYIKKFIPVSGPFGGATKALESCLTGVTEGLPVQDAFMRELEKRVAGNIWMINEPKTWAKIPPVNGKNVNLIPELLAEAGELETADALVNTAWKAWEKVYPDPDVPIHLVYGSGIKTAYQLQYHDHKFLDPKVTYEDHGDGTVNAISLEAPYKVHGWKLSSVEVLPKATHLGILNDKRYLDFIKKFV